MPLKGAMLVPRRFHHFIPFRIFKNWFFHAVFDGRLRCPMKMPTCPCQWLQVEMPSFWVCMRLVMKWKASKDLVGGRKGVVSNTICVKNVFFTLWHMLFCWVCIDIRSKIFPRYHGFGRKAPQVSKKAGTTSNTHCFRILPSIKQPKQE